MNKFSIPPCIRRTSLTFLLFICIHHFTNAQKEAWNWYFGTFAGIEFSTGAPVAVTNGVLNTYEGVASVSDTSGNLLFYTDGRYVYGSNHIQMPNGFGLLGNSSATQSAIIVRKPGSYDLYYIFTVDYNQNGIATGDGLNYSIVDITQNGGLGDVTVKNVAVRLPVYEKVTAVKHGNNRDYWILINDWISDDVYAYLLDTGGVNLTPVVSNAGPFHSNYIGNTAGYMKTNRQGNKLALAMWEKNSYDILDFDNLTGLASNHLVVQSNDMTWTYGVEFSPDGTKLYGTKMDAPGKLYQFDLLAGSATAILNSRVTLDSNLNMYHFCALQIAPDRKIYCALRYSNFLGVINDPDSAGVICNYVDNSISLAGKQSQLGLPNFVPDYITSLGNAPVVMLQSSDTSFCEKKCLDFFDLSSNNPTSWQWYFPGADSISSNMQNPAGICYSSYGYFDVTLIACNGSGCDSLTVTNFIQEYQSPPPPIITANYDTLFSSPAFSYQWYNSAGIIPGATSQYYVFQQQGSYYVIVTDSNGCMASSAVINTGIEEQELNHQFIYPNPSDGHFIIDCSEITADRAEVKIYDRIGRLVFNGFCHKGKNKTELKVNSGVYFIDLLAGNKHLHQKLMIIN